MICSAVHGSGFFAHAGNDEGGAGLVDQDGVHLVHNGERVAPLHQFVFINGHVVAQVVKAHFVVGAVGDIGGISFAAGGVIHIVDDQPHRETQEAVHLSVTPITCG